MSHSIPVALMEHAVHFLGQQTARQTHEITNVLNVLNELTGLMDDLLSAAAGDLPLDPARLSSIVEKMQRQIVRGENLVRGLNQFAHTVDTISGIFDLEELAERATVLTERPVRLARASLQVHGPERSVSLEGRLIGYLQALLTGLELVLQGGGGGHEVVLCYKVDDEALCMDISSEGPLAGGLALDEEVGPLEDLVSSLGGRVTTRPGPSTGLRVCMAFPYLRRKSG